MLYLSLEYFRHSDFLYFRTKVPNEAEIVMKMFGWHNYFQYKEMYPGSKIRQFRRYAVKFDCESIHLGGKIKSHMYVKSVTVD